MSERKDVPMATVSRVTLILEVDPRAPSAQSGLAIDDDHTIRTLPDGFLQRADAKLNMAGTLCAEASLPLHSMSLMADDTARGHYFEQCSESKYWTVCFENTNLGNRYNLLIEYDEKDYIREQNERIIAKYGGLSKHAGKETKPWWRFWK
jgi:hypothetical protein